MLQYLPMLASVAQGAGSIMDLLGVGAPKRKYSMSPSQQQAASMLLALNQPNNSLVEQETQQNMQKGMQDFLMQLKQMQMLDARRMGRGVRPTFFNPERADETVNYLTTRGLPAMTEAARNKARSDIAGRAQTLSGIGDAEQKLANQKYSDSRQKYDYFMGQGGFGGSLATGTRSLINLLSPNTLPWQGSVRSGALTPNPYVGVF